MSTSLEPLPFDVTVMAVEPGSDEVDARFEFDAPRFYDFKSGSPRGEELDGWFHTSATKGLATPEEAYAYAGPSQHQQQPQEQQPSPAVHSLPTLQPHREGREQPEEQQKQQATADAQQEAEQVRAALAHITGNPNLKLGVTVKATKKSASKSASKPRIQASNSAQKAATQRQTRTQAAAENSPKQTTTAAVTKKKTEVPAAAVAASKPVAKQTRSGAAAIPKSAPEMPSVQSKPIPVKAVVTSARPTSPKKKLRSETTTTAADSQQQARVTRLGANKTAKPVKAAALPPKPVTRGVQKKKPAPAANKRPTSAKTRGITVPHSPLLLSKHRGALHQQRQQQMKTTEEMEMEEVARGKREADRLRRQNAKTVKSVLTRQPKPVKHSTKPLTEPVAVTLRTSMRNREHGMETRSMQQLQQKKPAPKSRTANKTTAAFKRPVSSTTTTGVTKKRAAAPATRPKLTLPRTPNFATKARLRPSRYKPTEEAELDKLKNLPKFKARAVGKNVLNGKAVLKGHRGPTKAPTVPEPFTFKTDARAAKRPAPQPEQPAPFVFGSSKGRNGRVTRSRAKSATTTAATASTSGVDGSRRTTRQTRPRPVSASSSEPEQEQQQQVSLKRRRVTATGPFLLGGAVRVAVQKQATPTEEEEEQPQQNEQRQVPAADSDSEEMDVDSGDGMQQVFRGRGSGRAVMHNPLYNAGNS